MQSFSSHANVMPLSALNSYFEQKMLLCSFRPRKQKTERWCRYLIIYRYDISFLLCRNFFFLLEKLRHLEPTEKKKKLQLVVEAFADLWMFLQSRILVFLCAPSWHCVFTWAFSFSQRPALRKCNRRDVYRRGILEELLPRKLAVLVLFFRRWRIFCVMSSNDTVVNRVTWETKKKEELWCNAGSRRHSMGHASEFFVENNATYAPLKNSVLKCSVRHPLHFSTLS